MYQTHPNIMKNLLSSPLLILTLLVSLSGCLSDDVEEIIDDIDDISGTPGSLVADVNGDSFSSSGSFVTADLSDQQNGGFTITMAGVRFKDGFGSGIALVLFGTGFESLAVGDTFVGSDSERLVAGAYTIENLEDDNDSGEVNAGSLLNGSSRCTITKIDRTNGLISGTFSFDAVDEDTEETFEIRNGVFTDIEYN